MQEQIRDLHRAHLWVSADQRDHPVLGNADDSRQVSSCQAQDIEDTIAELEGQAAERIKEVKTMLHTTDMEAVCYAAEDIHIPAGQRLEGAVTAVIDKPLGDLHCAMVFEVEGIPRIAIAEPDDSGSEGDSDQAPELLSESSSEESSSEDSDEEEQDEEQYARQGHLSTAAMQRIKQTLQQRKQSEETIIAERAAAVPPMVVRPTMVSAIS